MSEYDGDGLSCRREPRTNALKINVCFRGASSDDAPSAHGREVIDVHIRRARTQEPRRIDALLRAERPRYQDWKINMTAALSVAERYRDSRHRLQAADDAAAGSPSAGPGPVRPGRLRIAVVAPPWFELPPAGYGGIESVVADLVNQLSDRGHRVLLVGAGRRLTRAARFRATFDAPPAAQRLGTPVPEVIHAARAAVILRTAAVDLVHDHTLAGPLLAYGRTMPTVVTMHGPVVGELGEYYAALGDAIGLVAISAAQRRLNPTLNWVGTVHNAIDVSSFPFRARKDAYLLWLGRFCADKAPHLAIDAARAVHRPIVLAGKCAEPAERSYFAREIAPRLGPGVTYAGEADAVGKRQLLAHARALLFPVQWDEPFGMVMIEAMACGTPVVALRRGSVPEVVADRVTGIIADGPRDLPSAIRAAIRLNPDACRHYTREHFDLPVMAAGYERVYRAVLRRSTAADRSIA
jgi:glycosyltransferase involved in cell wall biosynthesis